MKNQPCRGGYCETSKNRLSFKGRLNALEFDTFEDFCSRCDEIIYVFEKYKNEIDLSEYKAYIYKHKFCNNEQLNNAICDKCFEWIISYDYEPLAKNTLYALLGLKRKEDK